MSNLSINNASIELNSEDLKAIKSELASIVSLLEPVCQMLTVGTADKMSCGESTNPLEPLPGPEKETPSEKESKKREKDRERWKETLKEQLKDEPIEADRIIALSKKLISTGSTGARSGIKKLLKTHGLTRVSQADTLTDEERLDMYVALLLLEEEER